MKFFLQGLFAVLIVYTIGFFPPLTVAFTAVSIVFMFLVFGKE